MLSDAAGNELRAVECSSADNLDAPDAGCVWVEVPVPVSRNTVALVNGALFPKPRVFTASTALDARKGAVIERINADRNQRELGTFQWDGSTFDCDIDSQRRLQGAVQLAQIALQAGQSYSAPWRLADNTVRTLSAQDLIQVGIALGQHVLNVHLIARQLKAQAACATTTTELDNIRWPQP